MEKHKLIFIQYFRAIAAIMVIMAHCQSAFFGHNVGFLPQLGYSAVDIFFFISGFIISYIFLKNPSISSSKFVFNRILRIYPTYFQCYILIALCWIIFRAFPRPDFFYNLTLISFFDIKKISGNAIIVPDGKSVIVPCWTLYYEMIFYMVFSISIFLFKEKAKIGIYLFFIWSLVSIKFPFLYNFISLSPVVNFKFMAGFFMALIIFEKNYFINWILMNISILIVLNDDFRSGLILYLAAISTMICYMFEQRGKMFKSSILYLIGEASYSIYLFHYIEMYILAKIFKPFIETELLNIWPCIITSWLIILLAGIYNFKYFEPKNKKIFLKICEKINKDFKKRILRFA